MLNTKLLKQSRYRLFRLFILIVSTIYLLWKTGLCTKHDKPIECKDDMQFARKLLQLITTYITTAHHIHNIEYCFIHN